MLDPIYFQEKTEELEKGLLRRNFDVSLIENLKKIAQDRKKSLQETEAVRAEKNSISKSIGMFMGKVKAGDESAKAEVEKIKARSTELGDRLKVLEEELKIAEEKLNEIAFQLPNLPHESVPTGKDETANKEVNKWGKAANFPFTPKDHVTLGETLGILDFERASKIAGARFSLYLGAGATLERALIQFMLDLHTREHGYEEAITPFMVNRQSMTGTGQLPKFEHDLFKTHIEEREMFLIPTSEVPLTNIHAREILDGAKLPLKFTAYSPCFRSEAGSYGRDVRGLIRVHQFQKVELVKITDQESSFEELEKMRQNAEKVLELLDLPYRTVLLCTGDMGFGATKTYDLEVWLPSQNTYREISSCSNCGDFQARRAEIRYRKEAGAKPKLAHTLNGSGLAVGRTFVAILENYQLEDGSIRVPKVLHKYVEGAPGFVREGGDIHIKKR